MHLTASKSLGPRYSDDSKSEPGEWAGLSDKQKELLSKIQKQGRGGTEGEKSHVQKL